MSLILTKYRSYLILNLTMLKKLPIFIAALYFYSAISGNFFINLAILAHELQATLLLAANSIFSTLSLTTHVCISYEVRL